MTRTSGNAHVKRLDTPAVWWRGDLIVVFVWLLFFAVGCTGMKTVDEMVLQSNQVLIAIDETGWLVSAPGDSPVRVLKRVEVDSKGAPVSVTWDNQDGVTHEVMFGTGHHGESVRIAVDGQHTKRYEVGTDTHFHSHGAPKMPELRLIVRR